MKATGMRRNLSPCVRYRRTSVVEPGETSGVLCYWCVRNVACGCLTVINSNYLHSKIMNASSQVAFFCICQVLYFINIIIRT